VKKKLRLGNRRKTCLAAVSGLTPAQREQVLLFQKVIPQRLRSVQLVFFACFTREYYKKKANIIFWLVRKETVPIAQSKDAKLFKQNLRTDLKE
jgi:hypothetical protein